MAWELTRCATRVLSATSNQNHCLHWPSQGGHSPTHITRHPDVKCFGAGEEGRRRGIYSEVQVSKGEVRSPLEARWGPAGGGARLAVLPVAPMPACQALAQG